MFPFVGKDSSKASLGAAVTALAVTVAAAEYKYKAPSRVAMRLINVLYTYGIHMPKFMIDLFRPVKKDDNNESFQDDESLDSYNSTNYYRTIDDYIAEHQSRFGMSSYCCGNPNDADNVDINQYDESDSEIVGSYGGYGSYGYNNLAITPNFVANRNHNYMDSDDDSGIDQNESLDVNNFAPSHPFNFNNTFSQARSSSYDEDDYEEELLNINHYTSRQP